MQIKKALLMIAVVAPAFSFCSCERIDAGCEGIKVNLYGETKV